jgi:hypothetical protein
LKHDSRLVFNIFFEFSILQVRLAIPLNPDYSQGSEHGRGILQHLAENPTTNSQYPGFPWQGQPYVIYPSKPDQVLWHVIIFEEVFFTEYIVEFCVEYYKLERHYIIDFGLCQTLRPAGEIFFRHKLMLSKDI